MLFNLAHKNFIEFLYYFYIDVDGRNNMLNKKQQQNKLALFILSMVSIIFVLSLMMYTKAHAASEGDWLVRFGAVQVNPNDSSGTLSGAPTVGVAVDGDTQAFANISYMLTNNVALELLAATPFTHTISATGALSGDSATAKQLPPTLSLQYHFLPTSSVSPYVGAGLNYTTFFDEQATAVITQISMEDSWGLALQVGADFEMKDGWFANLDLRYIDIETTATTNLGTIDVTIDPWVFSAGVGFKF